MSTIPEPTASETTLPGIKPKRRKAKQPKRARVIDPGIAAIHAETRQRIAAYRSSTASAKLLKTIIEKRLAQMTAQDRQRLFDELSKTCQPMLLDVPVQNGAAHMDTCAPIVIHTDAEQPVR